MKAIRATAGLMLAFLCCLATAADMTPQDGVWLKNGIEAYNRAVVQGATSNDIMNGMAMAGWLGGVISAQRDTSSGFTIQMGFFAYSYSEFKKKKDEKNAEIVRTLYNDARSYVPKFDVPSGVQIDQIMAVVLKYLTNHPE